MTDCISPCASFLNHKEDFERRCAEHKDEIQSLRVLYNKLNSIEHSISRITDVISLLEKRQLTEDHIRLMMITISKDQPSVKEVRSMIKVAITPAIDDAKDEIRGSLWKMFTISVAASGVILTALTLAFKLAMTIYAGGV